MSECYYEVEFRGGPLDGLELLRWLPRGRAGRWLRGYLDGHRGPLVDLGLVDEPKQEPGRAFYYRLCGRARRAKSQDNAGRYVAMFGCWAALANMPQTDYEV